MYVPSEIRFRKERNFYLLNIRWANTIEITDHEAEFLMERQKDKKIFHTKIITLRKIQFQGYRICSLKRQ